MTSRFSGWQTPWIVAMALGLVCTASARAGEDTGDAKLLARLVQEIPLVASLYDKNEQPAKIEALPKYPSKKLALFAFAEKDSAGQEFKRFKANRPKYAKQFPLRAAILEAVDITETLQAQNTPMALRPEQASPKGKMAFLKQQGEAGIYIFKLEKVLSEMAALEEKGTKSAGPRWQAHFAFAQTRVLANLLFLYEYDFTLGQVRADNLPPLGKGQSGWIITAKPKLMVSESKAKAYGKDRLKRLKKIQEDYADTPWAFFAERDSRRDIGMEWVAKKK